MRKEPKERINESAIRAWQLSAHLFAIIPLLVTIAAFILAYYVDFIPYWIGTILAAVTLLEWGLLHFLFQSFVGKGGAIKFMIRKFTYSMVF